MAEKKRSTGWFRMDNAGLLYSAIQKERYSAVYRFSVVMKEKVQPGVLQRAVDICMPRFPGFQVRIRHGYFWNYMEQNPAPGPFVQEDMVNPCQPVRYKEDNGWLVRFFYYERRISLEVFHALADGFGAMAFLRTLLAVYLRQLGHDIPNSDGVLDVTQPPRREEVEDAYIRYAGKRAYRDPMGKTAYQNVGTSEPFYTLNVTMGFLPVDALKKLAKGYGVSITEYLTAVLLKVILDKQHRERPWKEKPVALAIPVNLRGLFPTDTLRNFILTVRPVIDPRMGEYTFPEIVSQVHHSIRQMANRQRLQAQFTFTVRIQENAFLQRLPGVFKSMFVAGRYEAEGVRPFSGTYTNPGVFRMPQEMERHVERVELILGQATVPRMHCASISCGNTMTITFAGTVKERATERDFFRFLVKEGLPVKVESNRPD
ncbi:MAG: hypothetical protein LUG13_05050 [Oscillospiraceae bacterium]|nr:hypothetical protein [Oscillospiraceae bacterium]